MQNPYYFQTSIRRKSEKKSSESETYKLPTQSGDKKGKSPSNDSFYKKYTFISFQNPLHSEYHKV